MSSTTGLTNGSGALTQSYLYGPFGESLNTPSDSNPFQYTGRENDGDGLLCYRARYYCPGWGRFISADPLGFAAGINPYVYAGDNPVNASDPSGLMKLNGWDENIMPEEIQAMVANQGSWARAAQGLPPGGPGIPDEGQGAALSVPETSAPSGGYELTTEPVAQPKTIVIGENMKGRVIPYAQTNGFSFYRPRGIAESPEGMVNNARMIYDKMRAGYRIIDIGMDPDRPEADRGWNYPMEVNIVVDANYPIVYDPQPAGPPPLPPGEEYSTAEPPGFALPDGNIAVEPP